MIQDSQDSIHKSEEGVHQSKHLNKHIFPQNLVIEVFLVRRCEVASSWTTFLTSLSSAPLSILMHHRQLFLIRGGLEPVIFTGPLQLIYSCRCLSCRSLSFQLAARCLVLSPVCSKRTMPSPLDGPSSNSSSSSKFRPNGSMTWSRNFGRKSLWLLNGSPHDLTRFYDHFTMVVKWVIMVIKQITWSLSKTMWLLSKSRISRIIFFLLFSACNLYATSHSCSCQGPKMRSHDCVILWVWVISSFFKVHHNFEELLSDYLLSEDYLYFHSVMTWHYT